MLRFYVPLCQRTLKKGLYGGDIVIEHKTETRVIEEEQEEKNTSLLSPLASIFLNSCFASPSVKTIRLADVQYITVANVRVATFTAWVLYSAQGSEVKSVLDGNGYFSNFWHVTVEKDYVSKYAWE